MSGNINTSKNFISKFAFLDVVLSFEQVRDDEKEQEKSRKPSFQIFHPGNKHNNTPSCIRMFSLESSDTHLICGDSEGRIFFYRWTDLEEKQEGAKPVVSFSGTEGGTPDCPAEINSLRVSSRTHSLISGGAGDNHVKIWSLENGALKGSFAGHTDYIHEVALRSPDEVLSASEDGSVRVWDVRTGGCCHMISPSITECGRQNFGKWIGCLAVEKDWMVCGGGPSLGLWHLGSMSLAKALNASDCEAHSALFYDDKIITGGSKSRIYHWNFRGEALTEVPVYPWCIYNVTANNSEQYKLLTACGTSSKVDVFINPGYRAFSLETYPLDN